MKKIFLFLSTILFFGFFTWLCVPSSSVILFYSYPSVSVIESPAAPQYDEDLVNSLNNLAKDHQSLIGRRIVEPNEAGELRYTYDVYGDGELPDAFPSANEKRRKETAMDKEYIIYGGDLQAEELAQVLTDHGWRAEAHQKYAPFPYVFSLLASFGNLAVFFITTLIFIAIIIIERTREMRMAGIRLISGERYREIYFRQFRSDSLPLFIFCVGGAILSLFILTMTKSLNVGTLSCIVWGTVLFFLWLSFLSLLFSGLFILGLRHVRLTEIIKGKMPVRRITLLMLSAQLVAFVMVGWFIFNIYKYEPILRGQNEARNEWIHFQDWHMVGANVGVSSDEEENRKDRKEWADFIRLALKEKRAFLAMHRVVQDTLRQDRNNEDQEAFEGIANYMVVSTSYLELQSVPVEANVLEQFKEMPQGHFGLLIPSHLQDQKETIISHALQVMKDQVLFGSEQSFEPIVGQIPSGQKQFLFNTSFVPLPQFYLDPVLLVIKPKSLGYSKESDAFLSQQMNHFLFFQGYDETKDALRDKNLFSRVISLKSGLSEYLAQIDKTDYMLKIVIGGALAGTLASVLLFQAMNVLYFEQFRKSIFIKRISGVSFLRLHGRYLLASWGVLLLGVSCVWYISKHLLSTCISLVLFLSLSILSFYIQNKRESQFTVTVMKGK